MAREKGKPVFMSETSAKGMNISSDEQDGINDWKDWFAKFWEFIAVHKEIKGFNYINANWPVSAYPGWGDSRIQNSAYVAQKYREEMKKPKYIHLPTKTGSLLIPLTDLGQEKYRDSSGGLYPGNSNIRPETHETDGIELANEIAPLDIYGSKDLMKGRIVLLSVGMSITDIEFNKFISLTDTFKMLNPYLTLVNGAQGGKTANIIRDPNDIYWKNIDSTLLKAKNVTNNQVQIVWLKNTNHNDGSGFPEFAKNLKEDLKKITKLMLNKYPNLKLVYLSTRSYGGYATIPSSTEPYAYETGFSVKWLIEEQISGSKDLTFSESGRNAPWLSWGPYFWANGVIPRNDGFFWLEEDFGPDGTHPSSLGAAKAANMLLDFFSTDKTAIPWFLAKPTSIENDNEKNGNIIISPNPASDYVEINVGNTHAYSLQQDLKIYNALGECVINLTPALSEGEGARFDVSQLVAGVYFVTYSGKTCKFIKY
jgi:hypothetical protein